MKPKSSAKLSACLSLLSLSLAVATGALAQEVLPQPHPPFKGKIERLAKDSTPDFPKGVEAPKGAPNVLLILTDDVGFGASSTFGGPIQTPNFQRLADSGLRYTMFDTTALCSLCRSCAHRHVGGLEWPSLEPIQVQSPRRRGRPVRTIVKH